MKCGEFTKHPIPSLHKIGWNENETIAQLAFTWELSVVSDLVTPVLSVKVLTCSEK